jgi:hypothetical protein
MTRWTLLLTCVASLASVYVFTAPHAAIRAAGKQPRTGQQTGSASSFSCNGTVVNFGPKVPGDALMSAQMDADCFGWAEFIALNWPTSGSSFGNPGDLSAVQWETYMDAGSMYPPNGQKPPPWGGSAGNTEPIPSACASQDNVRAESHGELRVLRSASKLVSSTGDRSFNFQQAAPENAPAWLGAQNGTNVWYEVLVNQDIYNYVVANQFYNATMQQTLVNNGQGSPIVFPKGALSGSPVGAIELKAAWMEVPGYNPSAPGKWNKYKLSKAVVVGPTNNQCRNVTVALVGLHIIHKTGSQPTWAWATFEHVDDVPGANQTSDCCNFNSTSCQPRKVTVSDSTCLGPNMQSPVTVSCTPNTSPPYYLGVGCPAPVPLQITRTATLDSNANNVNATAWKAIKGTYSSSVFQYYQLADVLWSTNATQDPTTPQKVPLNPASLTSGNPNTLVFNVTLESYFQNSKCTDCHRYANIAPSSANLPWDGDFSFALGTATPASSAATRSLRAAKPVRY